MMSIHIWCLQVVFHIHISSSKLPAELRKPKGTRRKSRGVDPTWTLPGKLFVYDFNLRQVFPLSETISYKYWSFDEVGAMHVIMTVWPMLSVPLLTRKRMPSFSAWRTRKRTVVLKAAARIPVLAAVVLGQLCGRAQKVAVADGASAGGVWAVVLFVLLALDVGAPVL
ncbi:cellulose synthase 1 [Striga asiatica]|uniref:Cellulose synthase 1 n=1 Tax=Striga asiatica TaxID=4170 RepID=A0A5A7PKI4_STRAF|nr:cellulose synthase 1 [Striga asiatica]